MSLCVCVCVCLCVVETSLPSLLMTINGAKAWHDPKPALSSRASVRGTTASHMQAVFDFKCSNRHIKEVKRNRGI